MMEFDEFCHLNDEQILDKFENITYSICMRYFYYLSATDARLLRIIRLVCPTFQFSTPKPVFSVLNRITRLICPTLSIDNNPYSWKELNWKILLIIFSNQELFIALCSEEYTLLNKVVEFLKNNPETPFKFEFLGALFSIVSFETVTNRLMNIFYPEGLKDWVLCIDTKNLAPERFRAFYNLVKVFPYLNSNRFKGLYMLNLKSRWSDEDRNFIFTTDLTSGKMIRRGDRLCFITRPYTEPYFIVYEATYPHQQIYAVSLLEAFNLPIDYAPKRMSLGIYPTYNSLALTAKGSEYVLFIDEITGEIIEKVKLPVRGPYNIHIYVSWNHKIFVFDQDKQTLYIDNKPSYSGSRFTHGDRWCGLSVTIDFRICQTIIFTDQGAREKLPYSDFCVEEGIIYGFDPFRKGIYMLDSIGEHLLYECDHCSSLNVCNGYIIFQWNHRFYSLKSGVIKLLANIRSWAMYDAYLNRDEKALYVTEITDDSLNIFYLDGSEREKTIKIPYRNGKTIGYAGGETIFCY